MTLLASHRRYMGLLVVGVLVALLLSNLIPDPAGRGIWRGGVKPPNAPWYQQWHGKLQRLGLYFQDNFGFRATLPMARRELREALGSEDIRPIYFGRNGQLFTTLQQSAEQSAGILIRKGAVERFTALMAVMQRHLEPLGAKLVVAIPPNAQSVDLEELPEWQDNYPVPYTEYSMMLDILKADGITAVDLRKVLRETPAPRRYLANDTHWTHMSSVLAFNATMRAAGHPDWQVNVAEVVGPMVPYGLGDLGRLLRRAPPLPDENQQLNLKPEQPQVPLPGVTTHHQHRAFDPYVVKYADSGPRVMVLGDSFTVGVWTRLFAFTPVSEAAWMHFSKGTFGSCDFNFRDVMRFRPDLVIVARTERLFPCMKDAWPTGLPFRF